MGPCSLLRHPGLDVENTCSPQAWPQEISTQGVSNLTLKGVLIANPTGSLDRLDRLDSSNALALLLVLYTSLNKIEGVFTLQSSRHTCIFALLTLTVIAQVWQIVLDVLVFSFQWSQQGHKTAL